MVSIMRPEQTLRLIQLYHANYPEIARNNQDADGRSLKLQMWAQITEELNGTYETQFTVEQFKKKVQNVQCTSRQKLYSGKRNLGEAEVEYLRLFETDKISEEVLVLRAKNRSHSGSCSNPTKSSSSASPNHNVCTNEFLAQNVNEKWENERSGNNSESSLESSVEKSAMTTINMKMEVAEMAENGETLELNAERRLMMPIVNEGGQGPTMPSMGVVECQQQQQNLDTAQQFLLAMLNVTLNGSAIPSGLEEGLAFAANNNSGENGKKRKLAQPICASQEDENQPKQNGQPPPTKRSRKPERPIRKEMVEKMEESERIEEKNADKKMVEVPMTMTNEKEGEKNDGEKSKNDETESLAAATSSLENGQNSNVNVPAELPKSSMETIPAAKCECQCHQKQPNIDEVEREAAPKSSLDLLCTRLDMTNKILEKIAEMIAQRLPPPPSLPMPNGNGK